MQKSMFGNDDLPLFSGTAPRGKVEPFTPKLQPRQVSMAACGFCADTGLLTDGFCWCEAGQSAKATHLQNQVLADARQLSSGVLSGLTGYTGYADIELIQGAFARWVSDNPGSPTWQAAWEIFWLEYKGSRE